MVRYSHHHLWIAHRRVIDKLAITKSASTPDGVAQIKIEEFKMNFSNNKICPPTVEIKCFGTTTNMHDIVQYVLVENKV